MEYKATVLWGEKKIEPAPDLVRAIMPKAKWWQWRYRKFREQCVRDAAVFGVRIYED